MIPLPRYRAEIQEFEPSRKRAYVDIGAEDIGVARRLALLMWTNPDRQTFDIQTLYVWRVD